MGLVLGMHTFRLERFENQMESVHERKISPHFTRGTQQMLTNADLQRGFEEYRHGQSNEYFTRHMKKRVPQKIARKLQGLPELQRDSACCRILSR